ncbi:MAG: hypothetical protein HYY24_02270 [Verrucomicrobia bacterium]|nr:hypothetical protein [Verrucomicrobiota bacterium]
MSDPANPRRVGGLDLGAEVTSVAVVAVSVAHAYVFARPDGLQVIDISDPANPKRVGRYDVEAGVSGVTVSGAQAYYAGDGSWDAGEWKPGGGLVVLNLSDPVQPRRVGGFDTGGIGGRVVVLGNYAHVAGLVIDISEPANPKLVSNTGDIHGSDVAVSGNYAYVARSGLALMVYDVTNPAEPRQVSKVAGPTSAVAVAGTRAYAADFSARGLAVIDVSDPTQPRRIGGYFGCTQDVAASGDYVYLADCDGLLVLDVSAAANPTRVSELDTGGDAGAIAVSGQYAYVADWKAGLQVIDVANPSAPKRVSGYGTAGWVRNVAVSGRYAYVAAPGDGDYLEGFPGEGLVVLDVSDPATPQLVGRYDSTGDATDVTVAGNYAYLIDLEPSFSEGGAGEGLVVIDISDPANPRRVGSYSHIVPSQYGGPDTVAVAGHYVYVADCSAGLLVIDVSDPANPRRAGGYRTSGCALGVAVAGTYALLSDWNVGLLVLDISDPTNPQHVGGYFLRGSACDFAVLDNRFLVATGAGVWAFDISNPASPEPVGGYSSSQAIGVAVGGGNVFVGAGDDGLVILEPRPVFGSIAVRNGRLSLSWEGFKGTKLQSTTSLGGTQWQDVAGSEATNRLELLIESGSRFFRLTKP